MKNAGTYEDWSKSAKAHDEANGNLRWKHVDQTNLYDHASIRRRLDGLRYHRSRHDHQGVVKALWEQGLLPDIISGSSGGAIVGALVCTHTDKELEALFDPQHLASRLGTGDYKPGIFPAVTLAARDRNGNKKEYLPTRKWVDGAVTDDLPAKRLARLYGVNHFIVSQTNPHVIPFIRENKRSSSTPSIISAAGVQTVRTWLNASVAIAQKRLWKNPGPTWPC